MIAILPIGFFAVGATLAEGAEHGELPMPPPLTRQVAVTLVAKLAIMPGLLMLLAAPLIDLPATYRLLAAMPTGLNAMVVSHAYGLDNQIVAEAVVWSTAIVVVRRPGITGVLMLHHVGIEIAPEDLDRAVEFFTLLGFARVEPPPELGGRFTWLQREGTQVHLMHEAEPVVPPHAHLAVVVPDYEATLRRLRERGFEAEPRRQHWGPRAPTRSAPAATGSS